MSALVAVGQINKICFIQVNMVRFFSIELQTSSEARSRPQTPINVEQICSAVYGCLHAAGIV